MLQNYLLKTNSLLLGCVCLFIFSACSTETISPQVTELTVEDKKNIADRILNFMVVDENYEILNRSEYAEAYGYLDNYINFIKNSELLTHRTAYNWKIHIIDDEEGTNAFTTPGGYIYFDTGLLKAISSEAAFMHLLANEIAYADKGFVTQKLQDNYGLQILVDLALGSSVDSEQLLNVLYNQPFDQANVEQADDFMLELACEKEYDADLLHWFLRNNDSITWIDVHPNGDLDARLAAINAFECTTPPDSINISSDTFYENLSVLRHG